MDIYELISIVNATRNLELEAIPFSIQASKVYNFVFLRSKKQPSVAWLTVEKLSVVKGHGVVVLSADCSICLEEILMIDLIIAAVQANTIAEKYGISQITSPNCRVDNLAKMAKRPPYEWQDTSDAYKAITDFANRFRHSLDCDEMGKARLKLTEIPE